MTKTISIAAWLILPLLAKADDPYTVGQDMVWHAVVPEYQIEIMDAKGDPIVGIKPDGTVVVFQKGNDAEAAEMFYKALGANIEAHKKEFCGQ